MDSRKEILRFLRFAVVVMLCCYCASIIVGMIIVNLRIQDHTKVIWMYWDVCSFNGFAVLLTVAKSLAYIDR